MSLKIYNTLSGKKEEFVPTEQGKVRMYACGITAYDHCHLGHARAAIVFDVIYRYLLFLGNDVVYVRNFTDVDDKIIDKANKEKVDFKDISEKYIKEFTKDMDVLGVKKPTVEPKASEHISDMIDLIKGIVEKGYGYVRDGDVFFSVEKKKDYGKLSGRNLEEMEAGVRIEIDEKKINPLDFALWKASKPNEPSWDSPWGPGRPGWHIECSVMSQKYLGETFDIHGGGKDLIFPHHENEIAQSEALTEKPFVNYWIHNGFVYINQEKMSKSLGNFFTIKEILQRFHPEVVRLFLLSNHYRSPIDFNDKNLYDSQSALDRFYTMMRKINDLENGETGNTDTSRKIKDSSEILRIKFKNAMDDDFNTARALGEIFDNVRVFNQVLDNIERKGDIFNRKTFAPLKDTFKDIGEILGLFKLETEEWFQDTKRIDLKKEVELTPDKIELLIRERDTARAKKDWNKADEIREHLNQKGIILEDTGRGTKWKVKR